MGRNRKKRRKIKRVCVEAASQLEALRDLAQDHSLTIRMNVMRCSHKKQTYHFIFSGAAGVVLEYWPGTGRTYAKHTGEKGRVPDCWAALNEAARVDAERIEAEGARRIPLAAPE